MFKLRFYMTAIMLLAFCIILLGCNANEDIKLIDIVVTSSDYSNQGNSDNPNTSETPRYIDAYKSVLQNNVNYFGITNYANGNYVEEIGYQGIYVYLKDMYVSDGIDDYPVQVTRFTVVDMNGDGISEVILELSLPRYDKLILRYENGIVYGYGFSVRGLNELKKDGTFSGSGGAGNWGRSRLQFSLGICKRIDICRIESDAYSRWYYINEEEVTEDKFYAFVYEQDAKEDAEWHEFTGANINRLAEFFGE